MLETLLSYRRDTKTSQLTFAMYYKDTGGNIDSLDFENADAVNQALSVRRHMTRQSCRQCLL